MPYPLWKRGKLISAFFKINAMCLQSVNIFLLSLLPRLNNPSSLNLSQRFMFSKALIILLQLSQNAAPKSGCNTSAEVAPVPSRAE